MGARQVSQENRCHDEIRITVLFRETEEDLG
jgi:hypothetical protein